MRTKLILSAILVPSFWVLLGILLLFSWVSLVGLVRDEVGGDETGPAVLGASTASRMLFQNSRAGFATPCAVIANSMFDCQRLNRFDGACSQCCNCSSCTSSA